MSRLLRVGSVNCSAIVIEHFTSVVVECATLGHTLNTLRFLLWYCVKIIEYFHCCMKAYGGDQGQLSGAFTEVMSNVDLG